MQKDIVSMWIEVNAVPVFVPEFRNWLALLVEHGRLRGHESVNAAELCGFW